MVPHACTFLVPFSPMWLYKQSEGHVGFGVTGLALSLPLLDHCRKVATEDFGRAQRGSQYDRPDCRTNSVYSLLPLGSLMLKAGEKDFQDTQMLFRDT